MMIALLFFKLAVLSVSWMLGCCFYFQSKGYPLDHPYTTIAFGPMTVILSVGLLYWTFFVW